MSTISKEVYDAFVAAGAGEEKSTEAAKAIAKTGERFDQMNDRFNQVDARFNQVDVRFSKIEADMIILKWMGGLILVVVALPMLKNLFG